MKVWVVTDTYYEPYEDGEDAKSVDILGIYTTKERAEALRMPSKSGVEIQVIELNTETKLWERHRK